MVAEYNNAICFLLNK